MIGSLSYTHSLFTVFFISRQGAGVLVLWFDFYLVLGVPFCRWELVMKWKQKRGRGLIRRAWQRKAGCRHLAQRQTTTIVK